MAEETQQEQGGKKKSGVMGMLILLSGVILVSSIVAMLLFKFLLAPKLSGEAKEEASSSSHGGGGGGGHGGGHGGGEPVSLMVSFDQGKASVRMRDPEVLPSILLYKVSIECANPATVQMVEANKARFTDMLRKLHSNLTEEDCADPKVTDSIQRQALEQGNDHLRRLQGEHPDPEIKITHVFHDEFFPATL